MDPKRPAIILASWPEDFMDWLPTSLDAWTCKTNRVYSRISTYL